MAYLLGPFGQIEFVHMILIVAGVGLSIPKGPIMMSTYCARY